MMAAAALYAWAKFGDSRTISATRKQSVIRWPMNTTGNRVPMWSIQSPLTGNSGPNWCDPALDPCQVIWFSENLTLMALGGERYWIEPLVSVKQTLTNLLVQESCEAEISPDLGGNNYECRNVRLTPRYLKLMCGPDRKPASQVEHHGICYQEENGSYRALVRRSGQLESPAWFMLLWDLLETSLTGPIVGGPTPVNDCEALPGFRVSTPWNGKMSTVRSSVTGNRRTGPEIDWFTLSDSTRWWPNANPYYRQQIDIQKRGSYALYFLLQTPIKRASTNSTKQYWDQEWDYYSQTGRGHPRTTW